MVGDDWESDIGGAQTVGLRTILVRTGKYQPEDENNLDPRPDDIIERSRPPAGDPGVRQSPGGSLLPRFSLLDIGTTDA